MLEIICGIIFKVCALIAILVLASMLIVAVLYVIADLLGSSFCDTLENILNGLATVLLCVFLVLILNGMVFLFKLGYCALITGSI